MHDRHGDLVTKWYATNSGSTYCQEKANGFAVLTDIIKNKSI